MNLLGPRRLAAALALGSLVLAAHAQPPQPPPRSARDAARADLTGNWVAQITEDWRWRMVTPPKGDYASIPLNGAGRAIADGWDPAKDDAAGEACKAFGAGGIMRQPTRLKISWADAQTLRVEIDAGSQSRLLHFDKAARPEAQRSWQGHSAAEWLGAPPPGGLFGFGAPPPRDTPGAAPSAALSSARAGGPPAAPPAPGGNASSTARNVRPAPPAAPPRRPADASVKVVTTNLRAGYLRKNGVPYSEDAVVTEYFDRLSMFGNDYLQVVTVIEDPKYLTAPLTVSNQFKLEADASKWNPTPCVTDPPFGVFHPSQFVP